MERAARQRKSCTCNGLRRAVAPCLLALFPAFAAAKGTDATTPGTAVSAKIPDAAAAPGGVLQLEVALTEPAPILRAQTVITYDPLALGPVLGVAIFGPNGAQDAAAGAAVIRGNALTVATTSPAADLGTLAGLPILAVAIDVPPDAPLGAAGALSLDPASSVWIDPAGQVYPQQVKNGTYAIAGALSVRDVSPGIGVVPAGAPISVRGVGFQPGATVDFDGAVVDSTTFVSDRELVATLAVPAELYGRGVKVVNPDKSRSRYYAYPRTAWLAPSARPLLAATDPIFAPLRFSSAMFPNGAGAGQFLGLALQNPVGPDAAVAVELTSSTGSIASASLALPAGTRVVRDVAELFPDVIVPADAVLSVTSSAPVQMLGLVGDDVAGTVVPLTPSASTP